MSISFSPQREVSFASDDDVVPPASEIFAELVADPSRCCQQCYRRLRARRRYPDEPGYRYNELVSYIDAVLPDGHDWGLVDIEYWESEKEAGRTERVYPPGGKPHESRGSCTFCGACEPHRSPSTRSRQVALEASVGISATLTEHAIPHNPLVLAVEVGDLKRDPDYAGDDFETFADATERAVRAAGGHR